MVLFFLSNNYHFELTGLYIYILHLFNKVWNVSCIIFGSWEKIYGFEAFLKPKSTAGYEMFSFCESYEEEENTKKIILPLKVNWLL